MSTDIVIRVRILLNSLSSGADLVTEMSQYVDQRADYLADDYHSGILSDEDSAEFDGEVDLLKALRAEVHAMNSIARTGQMATTDPEEVWTKILDEQLAYDEDWMREVTPL